MYTKTSISNFKVVLLIRFCQASSIPHHEGLPKLTKHQCCPAMKIALHGMVLLAQAKLAHLVVTQLGVSLDHNEN